MKKILIIEDDVELCQIFVTFLKTRGYEVIVAHDGHTGLVALEDTQPDMLIVDLLLPQSSYTGTDVIAYAKKDYSLAIPVIAMSAGSPQQVREAAINAGCDLFLSKPFDLYSVLDQLDEYLA